jgi:predicted RNA-binding Zn-ribbon protein involved in translation (DUF1610 family)
MDFQKKLDKTFKEFENAWEQIQVIRTSFGYDREVEFVFQQYIWPSLAGVTKLRKMFDLPTSTKNRVIAQKVKVAWQCTSCRWCLVTSLLDDSPSTCPECGKKEFNQTTICNTMEKTDLY